MSVLTTEKDLNSMKEDKKWVYDRLVDRLKELKDLYYKTHDSEYLSEDNSICHMFECGGWDNYEIVASFCEERNIKRVVDIGCAYGHQSETFLQSDIDYMGVCDHELNFWNKEHFSYEVGTYPCELPLRSGDLGVSVLCLTWNVYLQEGQNTLKIQCEALQRDFEHCLIYVQPSHLDVLKGYFKHTEHVSGNFYYFSNK